MGKKKTSKISAPAPVARAKAKAKVKEAPVEAPVETHDESGSQTTPAEVVDLNEAKPQGDSQGDSQYSALVPLLHRLLDTVETKTAIPAITESCSCGASMSLAESVPEADRKRIHNAYLRRHKPCTEGAVAAAE